jgi:hypothetical protein
MQLQHVNVKLLVRNATELEPDLELLIPVFHGWIRDQSGPELLLDVADYTHVDGGPGVILIGHEGNYSVDNTDHRLGIRYNRKAALDGSNQDHLKQAAHAALTACQRLEAEPLLGGKLQFNGQEIEIFINDRLVASNSDATRAALDLDFQNFSKTLFRGGEYSMSYGSDSRKLFAVTVKAARSFAVSDLLENLAWFMI